jgi:multiple sugar transport system substrate-binding protein
MEGFVDEGKVRRVHARGGISRRRFLKLGGAGLAGVAMLGAAGCGGEEGAQGGTQLTLPFGPDESGGLRTLIDRFNKENKVEIRVHWREAPALSDEYFDQIRTELQSGSANMDVIAGDVIWPAQLAAAGYILDLSDQ